MPRNIERDEKEAMRRKEQLMEAGFRLFSQYGIEKNRIIKKAVSRQMHLYDTF